MNTDMSDHSWQLTESGDLNVKQRRWPADPSAPAACGCYSNALPCIHQLDARQESARPLNLSAANLLGLAEECLKQRGAQYETDPSAPSQERSMQRIVQAFNACSGQNLSIREGYLFMVILKLVRQRASPEKLDNYVDAIAYVALQGEAANPK